MTPKEKAEELVCKMYGCEAGTNFNEIYFLNKDGYFIAKDCALIAVNEILGYMGADRGTEFWQEVKIEIENL